LGNSIWIFFPSCSSWGWWIKKNKLKHLRGEAIWIEGYYLWEERRKKEEEENFIYYM